LDSFFEITLEGKPALDLQQGEVSRYIWIDLQNVEPSYFLLPQGKKR
jgi:hypothetical protein